MASRGSNGTPATSTSTQGVRAVIPLDSATGAKHCTNRVVNSRYTLLTFLPLNFYEQFQRPLNMYFLLVATLQFIPAIAPVNPMSTLLPLLFAFCLTAAKEGYDDVKRHEQDSEYNARKYEVLRGGAWVQIRSEEIRVGDLIRVNRDQELPCDMVAVAAPPACEHVIHIRTDNLDGEIDLKARDLVPVHRAEMNTGETPLQVQLSDAPAQISEQLKRLRLECPPPSATIDSFEGRADVQGAAAPLSLSKDHLLPQSCLLKNTEAIFGVAVYTGGETKCGMNKRDAPIKWAKIDRETTSYSKIIFCCQMISAAAFGITGYAVNNTLPQMYWYLPEGRSDHQGWYWIIFPLRFFLLTSVMIPISFKFVVDMSKFFMSLVLKWDLTMYDDARGIGVGVKNSGIVEDLGQIEYVLSDKTGTMTKNAMELRSISVDGHRVQLSDTTLAQLAGGTLPAGVNSNAMDDFLKALVTCHSVEVEQNADGSRRYAAVSPDEEALVSAAAKAGFVLNHRDRDTLDVSIRGTAEHHIVHHVFPFSSETKSMSVITENTATKTITLTCKGADDKVLSLLASAFGTAADDAQLPREVYVLKEHLLEFANCGLRTLVVGQRTMKEDELKSLKEQWHHASVQLEGRAEAQHQVRVAFEKDLKLVGATAIEDELQDAVAATIVDLIAANVKVWMLTGDKVETAEQIAISCGLMRTTDEKIAVYGPLWQEVLLAATPPRQKAGNAPLPRESAAAPLSTREGDREQLSQGSSTASSDDNLLGAGRSAVAPQAAPYLADGSQLSNGPSGTVLVVQGGAILDKILNTPELSTHFQKVAMACTSVICARVTPSQKAAVTELVSGHNKLTLAIGDGGNDVSMIQAAHVGVGIVGKEGQQAARAADFSISQFKYLATLMFVHGHMSYKRTCYVVQYSFYKSMLISFIQLVFNISMTLVSGVSFWNSFSLTAWNGAYTLPPVLFYVLDRVAPRAILQGNPALYRLSQRGYGQTRVSFFGFIGRGIVQSTATLLLVSLVFGANFASSDRGQPVTIETAFTVAYSTLIVLQMFTVIIESNTITGINASAIFGMPLVYVAMTAAYSAIPRLQYFGVFEQTLNNSYFFGSTLICAALFLPHLAWEAARRLLRSNAVDELRSREVIRLQNARKATIRYERNAGLGALKRLWYSFVTPEESNLPRSTGYFV